MLSKKLHAQLKKDQLSKDQQLRLLGGYREIPFAIEPTTRIRWDEVIIRFSGEASDIDFKPNRPNSFGGGSSGRLFRPIP